MQMSLFSTFILMCCIACLTACDSKVNEEASKSAKTKNISKAIEFKCDEATGCSDVPVGMLHLGSIPDQRVLTQRCLATKIGYNKILTSRYCVESSLGVSLKEVSNQQIFFSYPKKDSVKVINVVQASAETKSLVQKSFVVLEVEQKLDLENVHLEKNDVVLAKNYELKAEDKFWVYSAEEKWNSELLVHEIELKRSFGCALVESPVFFPYQTTSMPETFVVSGCEIIKGYSGSPLINAKGEIVGVIQSRVDSNAIFDFVSKRFENLIDWDVNYVRFFGLVTNASCIFDECTPLGKQIVQITQFPKAGYKFQTVQKDILSKVFKQNFPSPYSHFEWQISYAMVRDQDGTYSIEAVMRPVCFTQTFEGFLKSKMVTLFDSQTDKVTWGISAGFIKTKLLLNDKFQILTTDADLKVENFKVSATEVSKFQGQSIHLEIFDPFKKTVTKKTLSSCMNQSFNSWSIDPQDDFSLVDSSETWQEVFQVE